MTVPKILSILLKLAGIALLVVGMGFVAYFTKEVHDEATKSDPTIDPYDLGSMGRFEFYLYSTGVGVVFAVFTLVCVLAGLLEKKDGAIAMSAAQAICALQLLVSTALIATVLTTYQKEGEVLGVTIPSRCEQWDEAENRDYDYTCDQVTAGVVCGFLAAAVFAADTFISFICYTQAQ